jgi:hypothetical protein
MEIELDVFSERFDPHDDRWLDQVAQLVTDLRREVGEAGRHADPSPGMKGSDFGPIVVYLSSAGAFMAVAEVLKAFINRDRGRSIRATRRVNDHLEQIEINGSNVEQMERLVAGFWRTAPSPGATSTPDDS